MRLVDADKLPISYDGHTVSVWKNDLDSAPTVDLNVYSHWERGGKTMKDIYCIECGYVLPRKCNDLAESGELKRCPNCGAIMQ